MSMKAIAALYSAIASIPPKANLVTLNGNAIDFANTEENMIIFNPGVITDGVHTPSLQDSPDNVTWTNVLANYQIGVLAPLASNTVQKVAYIGPNRYVRPVITVTGAPATGGVYSVNAMTKPRKQPAP